MNDWRGKDAIMITHPKVSWCVLIWLVKSFEAKNNIAT